MTSGHVITSGRSHFRGTRESLTVMWSLPVARSLPGDWGVTSDCAVTSGDWGAVARSLPGDWGVTSGGVTWAKTMVVTSISHMGEMRDSDWSRPNFLRSDWLLPI